MTRTTAYTVIAALVVPLADPATAHDPVLVGDLKENVRARLVSARISETRGQYLIAKLETVGDVPQPLLLVFPAHSLTTHEQTLSSIIKSCVRDIGVRRNEWHPARAEVIFSVPDLDAQRDLDNAACLERCALISIDLAKER